MTAFEVIIGTLLGAAAFWVSVRQRALDKFEKALTRREQALDDYVAAVDRREESLGSWARALRQQTESLSMQPLTGKSMAKHEVN